MGLYDFIITQSPSGPTSKDTFGNKFLVETELALKDAKVKTFVDEIIDGILAAQREDTSVIRALLTTHVARGEKKDEDSTWKRFRFNGKVGERDVADGEPCMRRFCALFDGSGEKFSSFLFLRGCYYHDEVKAGPDGDPVTIATFVPTKLNALATILTTHSDENALIRIVGPAKPKKPVNEVRTIDDWTYLGVTEHDVDATKRSTEEKVADAAGPLAQQLLDALEAFVEEHGLAIGPIGVWLNQPGSQGHTLVGKIVAAGAGAAAIAFIASKLPASLKIPVSSALSEILL